MKYFIELIVDGNTIKSSISEKKFKQLRKAFDERQKIRVNIVKRAKRGEEFCFEIAK